LLRIDGRAADALRPVRIVPSYLEFAEGSALIEMGKTWVLCAASVEDRVPPFRRGNGWLTAEYSMLPRSTPTRSQREVTQGRPGGRTQEIQRLIGRALRSVVELKLLGERTITVDCDVLQADGGTRTAAITGAYVAVYQACQNLLDQGLIAAQPLRTEVAAVSVGVVEGTTLLDLCYDEDSRAQVDFNVVMTGEGEFVEVQGTAEGRPFSRASMDRLLELADGGIKELLVQQRAAVAKIRK
jgi:ribonuclease PH